MSTTPTERLAAAEARHTQILSRLDAARIARDDLRSTLAKTREAYLADSARVELEGGERPPRPRLTELEQQLSDAEERLAVLERAVGEAAHQVRHARADVLDEQAVALEEDAAERESLVRVLREQIEALQRQINEHYDFIRNNAGVRPQQLAAEARRLRSTP